MRKITSSKGTNAKGDAVVDLTSLIYALMVSFGLFGMDAVWNADTIRTEFMVAQSFEDSGTRREFATTAFAHEMRAVFSTESLVKPPPVRSSADKSFVSILADSLGMQNATAAFQDLFGLEPVTLMASLIAEGERRRIEVIGNAGRRGGFYVSLDAEPGEQPVALIRRGAVESAARLDPYHTALYLLDPPAGEPAVPRAQRILDEAIAAHTGAPARVHRAQLRNLRGIASLLEGDTEAAATLFEQAIADDVKLIPAHLNLAFVRVQQDRYDDAAMIARHVLRARGLADTPALIASAHTILASAAWAQERHALAEEQFAAAVAAMPTVSDAYIYWGRLLTELGRPEEGAAKARLGEENLQAFENYPEVALLYFWLAENRDTPLQRRARPSSAFR